MKQLIVKQSQSSADRRAINTESPEFPVIKTIPIARLRKAIVGSVRHAIKIDPDEAYDYKTYSWRGTGVEKEHRVDIYETDMHGHVTACLWREYYDENNIFCGSLVAAFSVIDMVATIEVINKWMNGVTIPKIRKYITTNHALFPDADLDNKV